MKVETIFFKYKQKKNSKDKQYVQQKKINSFLMINTLFVIHFLMIFFSFFK